ncbi:MAG: hypothetical protein D6718_13285 [Acidobacteria bacterium]|nr:MAG: hypothetical protein D6718_13285 [Acidobacteriota bacterium]
MGAGTGGAGGGDAGGELRLERPGLPGGRGAPAAGRSGGPPARGPVAVSRPRRADRRGRPRRFARRGRRGERPGPLRTGAPGGDPGSSVAPGERRGPADRPRRNLCRGAAVTAFLDERSSLPYCPGCGHSHVLRALDAAIQRSGVEPRSVVLVTDIGCVGLADRLFPSLHTVHALHGRAAAVACGMQVYAAGAGAAPVKPIVLVGDGGATIGLLHLVHAAQLDADVTVLVHNNLVYGMTGGQHSGFTPEGLPTTTTPGGNPVPPIDLAGVLAAAGAGYFARSRVPAKELPDRLAAAIARPGFACVELLELCPTFAARVGGVTGKDLGRLAEERGGEGVIFDRPPRRGTMRAQAPPPAPLENPLEPHPSWSALGRTVRVAIGGRAGEGVQSAARLAAAAAALAGLWVAVRTDNPVTQGTGFSLAELALSPDRGEAAVPGSPDLVIAIAPEGMAALGERGWLGEGSPAARTIIDEELPGGDGLVAEREPLVRRFGRRGAALGALALASARGGWFVPDAWRAAAERLPGSRRSGAERVLEEVFGPEGGA